MMTYKICLMISGLLSCSFLIAQKSYFQPKASFEANTLLTSPVYIDLHKPTSPTVSLRDFVEIVEVIPLASEENALISNISKVIVADGKYYIADFRNRSSLKVFDASGNYIGEVGSIGRGPGEYINVTDIENDPYSSSLYLLSNRSQKLFNYQLDGTFINSSFVQFYPAEFAILDKGHFAFYTNFNTSDLNESHNLLITDRKLTIQQKLFPYPMAKNGNKSGFGFSGFLNRFGQDVLYTSAFQDTIYQINTNTTQVQYILHLENVFRREKHTPDQLSKYNFIGKLHETSTTLSIGFKKEGLLHHAFWRKKERILIDNRHCSPHALNHLLLFEPKGIKDQAFINEISLSSIEYLQDKYPKLYQELKVDYPELYSAISRMKDTDNSILVVYKIR